MIFVDTNVFMYAVGQDHPLKGHARDFFDSATSAGTDLFTSAEVLQELLNAYVRSGRLLVFEAAMSLIRGAGVEVWPLERGDVELARELHDQFPELESRDLCYLASCRRRGITYLMTFDQALAAASGTAPGLSE